MGRHYPLGHNQHLVEDPGKRAVKTFEDMTHNIFDRLVFPSCLVGTIVSSLSRDLREQHVHLENNILFPRALAETGVQP